MQATRRSFLASTTATVTTSGALKRRPPPNKALCLSPNPTLSYTIKKAMCSAHQLGQDLIFALDLLLQVVDAFLLGLVIDAAFGLEGGGPVLEELLLPAVEYRWLESSSSQGLETRPVRRWRLRMATFSSPV